MQKTLRIDIPAGKTYEKIYDHYIIEKELANRLYQANKEERTVLYSQLYDELFTRVPWHPQLTLKTNAEDTRMILNDRMNFLFKYIQENRTFLEIGPGDCTLSLEVAKYLKHVYAIDVSREIVKDVNFPENVSFTLSDGCEIPVRENSVDIAYSNQLMEHLHPEDAFLQLTNIFRSLVPGGSYICITPNKFAGPHDISKYFDEEATGFHMKEYAVTELYRLFKEAGFSKVFLYRNLRLFKLDVPLNKLTINFVKIIEKTLISLPYKLRKKFADTPILFRDMTIIGVK